jgi:hypothetical protein
MQVSKEASVRYQTARLRVAYKLYIEASMNPVPDEFTLAEMARDMTDSFIEYITDCQQQYNHWELESAIDSQIRVLYGLSECYRKAVVVDSVTEKTRWSL